ncbi:suppressor of fused domain protein [Pseudoduganella sp. SL102]|uniref:suppressor of fused domain protein n=1 Tax=Pseudoduganella sp. SL102 TaxID=2995154 RepID=UPI00248C9429|nr:suppressor of fused domain protein [Pseudoduganella sp. SL102]WBS02296.1 suppressor of fused domain protein [Pseudoduganella sp. SL102]
MNDYPTDSEDDVNTAGWDAIEAALAPLYGDQKPQHMGTLIGYRLGGPDPLDGISAYYRAHPVPHWHYVTYGFSELYDKEEEDEEVSGYGFELTFRLRAAEGATEAPRWVFSLLQNLARYVFNTGNVFRPGEWMTANGPIALDTATRICSMAMANDPELPAIETPNGRLEFIQVVGLTQEEEYAAKQWSPQYLLDTFLPHMPLWITDLERGSLLDVPSLAAEVEAGLKRDGSGCGALYTDVLDVVQQKRLLRATLTEITFGARQVDELRALLPLRIPFERPFVLAGRDWHLQFEPGEACSVTVDNDSVTITMTPACSQEFASILRPQEGRYQLDHLPTVSWIVQKTSLRDPDGNVVSTAG